MSHPARFFPQALQSSVSVELTTQVIAPNRGEFSPYYSYKMNKEENFTISLHITDDQNSGILGFVTGKVAAGCPYLVRMPDDIDHPRHVLIQQMENTNKAYRHVGSALHEAAFRFSLEQGAQGRVRLDAVRNTHYFHYRNGFRLENLTGEKNKEGPYYKMLAKAVKAADGRLIVDDLGSNFLYLPEYAIRDKMRIFNIKGNNVAFDEKSFPTKLEERDPLAKYLRESTCSCLPCFSC